jgi:acyl carrier protein
MPAHGSAEGDAVELRAELKEAISRVCDLPVERISDDSTVEELGFDSLASAEVLIDLEIRLDRELPVDAMRRLIKARTVGEVALLLEQELRAPRFTV